MLRHLNQIFLTHYFLKLTIVSVKISISFTNWASKSQLKLIGGFLFFAPSALMGLVIPMAGFCWQPYKVVKISILLSKARHFAVLFTFEQWVNLLIFGLGCGAETDPEKLGKGGSGQLSLRGDWPFGKYKDQTGIYKVGNNIYYQINYS